MALTQVCEAGGNANSPYVWKNKKMEEATAQCSGNKFPRSYEIPGFDEQMDKCALSKGDALCFQ
jgi:hypothetical protein